MTQLPISPPILESLNIQGTAVSLPEKNWILRTKYHRLHSEDQEERKVIGFQDSLSTIALD